MDLGGAVPGTRAPGEPGVVLGGVAGPFELGGLTLGRRREGSLSAVFARWGEGCARAAQGILLFLCWQGRWSRFAGVGSEGVAGALASRCEGRPGRLAPAPEDSGRCRRLPFEPSSRRGSRQPTPPTPVPFTPWETPFLPGSHLACAATAAAPRPSKSRSRSAVHRERRCLRPRPSLAKPAVARATDKRRGARALILFSGESSLRRTVVLRRGFRHCAVLLERQTWWLFLNPLASGLLRARVAATDPEDLSRAYRTLGWTVLEVCRSGSPGRAARPGQRQSCVAFTKRAIGLRAPGVVTPHQLFRHIAP